ncbi:hypothetical protein LU293_08040 [Moraxella nasovis]|uniref:hypothetical protein n=1 Tax=Moraxella nasovis TaxID=2904121 RepID=UPI001F5FFA17|nr:hypothetical protein [Moraxella nasovis]UNU73023.1 hypothetical protein LU293_08040 [Moraxella nasovis]
MTRLSPNEQPNDIPNQNNTLSRGILNVLLVFIESALTLVLRFDPKLRRFAYPLAQADKVVCIRTYLPHTQVYATFGYRGILLDNELPAGRTAADITINAYSFQIINALLNHSEDSVEALQIRGEAEDVDNLKAFLVQLGLGGVVHNILSKFTGKSKDDSETATESKTDKLTEYKNTISEQNDKISALETANRRLNTQVVELQNKQRATLIGLVIVVVLAIILAITCGVMFF